MLEVAQVDFKLGFVHVKAPQGCRKSLAEFSSLSPILLPEASATILSRRGRSAPTTLPT